MTVHKKKMYLNGLWESVIDLGRSLPRLTTLAVMSLGFKGHIKARTMFMYINYMVYVEDMFCFSVQMAIKLISEAVVAVCRIQVGSRVEEKLSWNANLTSDQGPVVQSIVSLTSSLRVISLTVLVDSTYNILIFFAEKM